MSRRRATLFALFTLTASAFAADSKESVPGPESDQLRQQTTGYLLLDRGSRQITATELSSLKETVISPSRPQGEDDDPTIHMLAGPDSQGRIAYIEDHFFVRNENTRRHLLKI